MTPPEINAGVMKEKRLSPRQRAVATALARGKLNKEIADELKISRRTVEEHVHRLYSKLGVHNRVEATRLLVAAM